MKRMLTVDDLARDQRFERIRIEDVVFDPRRPTELRNGFAPKEEESPDAARGLMHAIFVGEIQALEGAGRTCYDFDTGTGHDEAPFELKLDMARQCWDEARHVEISVKLTEHMGSEIGEFAEQTLLFEAACNADPVLRLTGVNRALERMLRQHEPFPAVVMDRYWNVLMANEAAPRFFKCRSSPWPARASARPASTPEAARRPSPRSDAWCSAPTCSTASSGCARGSPESSGVAPSSTTCRCCRSSRPKAGWSGCRSRGRSPSTTWASPKAITPLWLR